VVTSNDLYHTVPVTGDIGPTHRCYWRWNES